ncbi:MAG: DHA2 family efflux MFS transporter permease subunit [Peptococcaceae bacterium]|nr:DHA2 family efflux MFS transporter permease subunit [Peptococcaceae bacterium]
MSTFTFERRLDARLIIAVVATGLMSFTGICVETAMNVVFPTLMREFNIPTSTVQWVTTIYLLVLAIIIPASSWLKKRFMTRTLFGASLALFIVGTLFGLWSPYFAVLMLGRVLQGAGTGITLPMMFNIIVEQVPTKNIGMIMGFATLTIALGPAVGPALGGFIINYAGWRMIFGSLLPILIISAIGGMSCIRQSSPLFKEPFDISGFLMLSMSFICLIYGLSNISYLGVTSPTFLGLILVAILFLALFSSHCRKAKNPLLYLGILRTKRFTFSLMALLLLQFFTLSRGFMIPNLFQLSNGLNAFEAGCILLPACIVGALLNPVSGRVYDRFGAKLPILFGVTCIFLEIILEMFFMCRVSSAVMMGICVIYCLGQGFGQSNITTYALRGLPLENNADGTAVINTLQQLFGAIGTAVASTLVSMGQASLSSDIAAGTALGTQWALTLNVGLSIVMVALILMGLRYNEN